jgi:cytochrome c-type biogenesis protein CcmH/NrfG
MPESGHSRSEVHLCYPGWCKFTSGAGNHLTGAAFSAALYSSKLIRQMMYDLRRIVGATLLTAAAFLSSVAATDPAVGKLLAEGRVDNAILLLQGKIDASPHDAESYNYLCRAYFMVGEWDPGIAACEKAVAHDPDNSEYHAWLGRIYGEKADHSSFVTAARLAGKVRNEFEAAVRLSPKSVDARADLADFYLEAPGIVGGGKDKAEAQAQEIAKLDPAQGHRVEARIAEKKKDYAAAENEYRLAIQASGGKAGTWLNLARFYRHTGRLDEMEDALKHATAPEMNRPDLLMGAAEMLINAGRYRPEATQLLRRYLSSGATVEDAPVFKAHYLLGTILEREDKQAAAAEYRAALSLAKDFSPAQNALKRLQH